MITIDDKRGEGVKNAEKLMTSYANDPLPHICWLGVESGARFHLA
jgi:hypothetical protein